jgi:ATP-dependent Clp protease adaptor protein ClpS
MGIALAEPMTIHNISTPDVKVIERTKSYVMPPWVVRVLDDDHNTFEHVANCLIRHIPNMTPDTAWALTEQVHQTGQAAVWRGPKEQAEHYYEQLKAEGLTMAPIEPD